MTHVLVAVALAILAAVVGLASADRPAGARTPAVVWTVFGGTVLAAAVVLIR